MKDITETIKELGHKDSSKRIHAAETLGMMMDDKAVDALIPVLKDKDRFVRQEVALALGKIGGSKVAEHLKTYAHKRADEPVDVVNLRLLAKVIFPAEVAPEALTSSEVRAGGASSKKVRKAYYGKDYGWLETPILGLPDLSDKTTKGPLIIELYDATCVVPPYAEVRSGKWGTIEIDVKSEEG